MFKEITALLIIAEILGAGSLAMLILMLKKDANINKDEIETFANLLKQILYN